MALDVMIMAATGQKTPELVLKNGKLINVLSGEIYQADIAIDNGYIVGVGQYKGQKEVDLTDHYLCPGLIDGHIHLESSMVTPQEFAKVVLPRGTTTVVTDPHEIANVSGRAGIEYMMDATEDIPLNVYFMVPSCVPATMLDENGAEINAGDIAELLEKPRVLGLAEMMNFPGVLHCDSEVLGKIAAAREKGRIIDGHAPGLSGKELCAYIAAGIRSDHECTSFDEALERVRLGQWVMVREGTAGKNLLDLMPLLTSGKSRRCMLVTDDKHPGDLIQEGHLDFMIRSLISRGVNPVIAIQLATLNPAEYFGLKELGAIAPGYRADLVVLSDLNQFKVKDVYKDGRIIVQEGDLIPFNSREVYAPQVQNSFHMPEMKTADFTVSGHGSKMRVIGLVAGQILTRELFFDVTSENEGVYQADIEQDLLKLAVVERHKNTAHIGVGFVHGYGLKRGAIASSVAHDSHNLLVIGADNESMRLAANAVRAHQGGLAIADSSGVLAVLPLPIAGLLSSDAVETVDGQIQNMKRLAREMGVFENIDPFMTLSFLALSVIPELKLTSLGLVKVSEQKIVEVIF